jgi:DNA uptake protein ComE-like DNA-binding protein
MSKRLNREFYLLPRGEQRALILLSLLLILSLLFRISVQLLPDRKPEGLEEFEQEDRLIMASFARADSLKEARSDSLARSATIIHGKSSKSLSIPKGAKQAGPVNINRADSAQLLPLPGIGPVFAGRIIKFRNLLGGFISSDQLGEVYGMPAETLERIKGSFYIDTTAIHKVQLNSATFSDLLRHPYLEYGDVKSLVKYREFIGNITSINELRRNQILPDTTLDKVEGYFNYSRRTDAVDLSK